MSEFNYLGRILLILGVTLVILGALFLLIGKSPLFSKLPGNIIIQRKNVIFYFPLGLCILVSVILTIIFRFFKH